LASEPADPYAALGRAFAAAGARWFVFGAQAAILHGAVRFTEDIDVTVDAMHMSTPELVAHLEGEGLSLRVVEDVDTFVAQTRVLPMLHDASMTPVDVVLSGPGIEELFFERVIMLDVGGIAIPVAAAEDLVVMKVLAGRPKDLEDVVAVLSAQPALEVSRVRELLAMLERALDQSDLLPAFEAAFARACRARHP
jgi:predicted nucleotidyltransferase